jgi:hypothetical protein
MVTRACPFIEETAFERARFPNVWVKLETTSNLAVTKPSAFEKGGVCFDPRRRYQR